MTTNVRSVEYQEAYSILVGKFLLERGFTPATSLGVAVNPDSESDELGILTVNPDAKPQTALFGLVKKKPRRIFFGTIWFENEIRHATLQNWVFEVSGREYVETAKKLATDLASMFEVKITVRLVSERASVEGYHSDVMRYA